MVRGSDRVERGHAAVMRRGDVVSGTIILCRGVVYCKELQIDGHIVGLHHRRCPARRVRERQCWAFSVALGVGRRYLLRCIGLRLWQWSPLTRVVHHSIGRAIADEARRSSRRCRSACWEPACRRRGLGRDERVGGGGV